MNSVMGAAGAVGFLQVAQAADDICDRFRVDGPAQFELATGEHLVAHVEPFEAKGGFLCNLGRVDRCAHAIPFEGRKYAGG